MTRRRDTHTPDLFGGGLLPEITPPTIGHIAKPEGEWVLYCGHVHGFNAVAPATWGSGYQEGGGQ